MCDLTFLKKIVQGYSPTSVEEDIPMTMQIAIEAQNGFVLASDTRSRQVAIDDQMT
jgi:hypothetical protein